jgi:hypothetical protein
MTAEAGLAAARIIELARADGIAARMHELTVTDIGTVNLAIRVDAADVEGWRLSKRQKP